MLSHYSVSSLDISSFVVPHTTISMGQGKKTLDVHGLRAKLLSVQLLEGRTTDLDLSHSLSPSPIFLSLSIPFFIHLSPTSPHVNEMCPSEGTLLAAVMHCLGGTRGAATADQPGGNSGMPSSLMAHTKPTRSS